MPTGYCALYARRGIFLKFRPREREISKFGLPKASTLRGPLCLPCCSGCYLVPSLSMLRRLGFTVLDLVVGPSWQIPGCSSWAAVAAEKISCWSPRDCELRLARGSHMAAEVSTRVCHSVPCMIHVTGTITELPSQSQPPMSPGRCRSLNIATVDRLYLKVEVQHATRL